MSVHVPERPGWTCRDDGQPWPCAGARVHLACQYDPVTLSVVMGQYLHNTIQDLPGMEPAELWTRFLAWVRHPLAEHRPPGD